MKKLLFICLLAGSRHSVAQNISITDLFVLLDQPSTTSINELLQPKGFTNTPARKPAKGALNTAGSPWVFTSNDQNNAFVSQVIRRFDSTGGALQYQTTNPFFFTSLLNELPQQGFSYYRSQAAGNELQLNFTNGGYLVCTEVLTRQPGCYTITLTHNSSVDPYLNPKHKKAPKAMKKMAFGKIIPAKKAPKVKKATPLAPIVPYDN